MKKLFALLLSAALVLSVSACGGAASSASDEKTMDIAAVAQQAVEATTYDDELTALSEKTAPNYYDLSFDGLEEYVIYVSATSATVSELAIFHCKDAAALDSAKAAVEKRLEKQRENYENYRPDELLRLDNALVKTSGNYLLLSVADDNTQAEEIFDNALK